MAYRDPTPEELAELNGPAPAAKKSKWRDPTPDELRELTDGASTSGPYRDTFSATKPHEAPGALAKPTYPVVTKPEPTLWDKTKQLGTDVARRVTEGATFGHAAEASAAIERGLGKILPEGAARAIGIDPGKGYAKRRDEFDTAQAKSAENVGPVADFALQSAGGLATGGVLRQGIGAAAKGVDLASKGVRALAPAAIEGAAAGSGYSTADLAGGDVGQYLRDVGTGAAASTALAGGGAALSAAVKKGGEAVTGNLRDRILNEVAESPGGTRTTPTAAKRVDRAGDNIFKEVVHGPDASKVRKAYQSSAKEGEKTLAPIIDRVGKANQDAYETFARAGRDVVDMDGMEKHLDKLINGARRAGKPKVADAVEAYRNTIVKNAADTGGMTLTRLRGLTTEAQNASASVLGGLNEHQRAQILKQVDAVAGSTMEMALKKAAQGAPDLEKAAAAIRENNKRMNALLTIKQSLGLRKWKEATGKSSLVSVAEKVASPAGMAGGVGAVVGMAQGDDMEDMAKKAAVGLAVAVASRGIPAAARAADRKITTLGIKAAQGRPFMPIPTADRLSRSIGRAGIAAHVDRDREDESK